jgi:DNA-binding transcriptional MerR regulator
MKLKPYLSTGDVARERGVSNQAIHLMDHLLKPTRDHRGYRRYDAEIVARVLAELAK